jgi:POT family proton-dependent oligopeptide transporter
MCIGLAIYIWGSRRYLPAEAARVQAWNPRSQDRDHSYSRRLVPLQAVIVIVVIFRGAYEQLGNTVALWADSEVDRGAGLGWTIPSTWFQALNPCWCSC